MNKIDFIRQMKHLIESMLYLSFRMFICNLKKRLEDLKSISERTLIGLLLILFKKIDFIRQMKHLIESMLYLSGSFCLSSCNLSIYLLIGIHENN